MDANLILCGTGHRPKDFPCKYDNNHPWAKSKLKLIQKTLRELKPKVVISGMALGYDLWLARVAQLNDIPVHAYIPCKNQCRTWPKESQDKYYEILSACEKEVYCDEGEYAAWKMQKRNVDMLNNSDYVLSLWNPDRKVGGTFNCVSSAHSMGKTVLNLWGDEAELIKFY